MTGPMPASTDPTALRCKITDGQLRNCHVHIGDIAPLSNELTMALGIQVIDI